MLILQKVVSRDGKEEQEKVHDSPTLEMEKPQMGVSCKLEVRDSVTREMVDDRQSNFDRWKPPDEVGGVLPSTSLLNPSKGVLHLKG